MGLHTQGLGYPLGCARAKISPGIDLVAHHTSRDIPPLFSPAILILTFSV